MELNDIDHKKRKAELSDVAMYERRDAEPSDVAMYEKHDAEMSTVAIYEERDAEPSDVAMSEERDAEPSDVAMYGRRDAEPSAVAMYGRRDAEPSDVAMYRRRDAEPSAVAIYEERDAEPSDVAMSEDTGSSTEYISCTVPRGGVELSEGNYEHSRRGTNQNEGSENQLKSTSKRVQWVDVPHKIKCTIYIMIAMLLVLFIVNIIVIIKIALPKEQVPKIAFTVYDSSGETSYTTIKFPNTWLNIGGGYSTNTGRFTCTVPGIYNFAVTLTKKKEDIDFISAHLRVNGENKLRLYSDPYDYDIIDAGSYSLSKTGNFHLNKNDYVDVYSVPGYFRNNECTSFTGILVIPDD